ncbi:MAG: membrane-spanning protein [Geosporobacter ferrireducens]|nr:membrane-spanning protein [Geosporobacter ferrireducens]
MTILLGTFVGYLFSRFKIPGGMMVGSIVAVSLFNITTGMAYIPAAGRLAAQIVAGAFIGVSVEKSDLSRLKFIIKPAIVLIIGMMILNIVSGLLIYRFSPLDLVTSLMCAVPGGMSDIPIISGDMGADASKVAVMQFIRLVAGIGFFPAIIAKIAKGKDELEVCHDEVYKRVKSESHHLASFIMTIVIAAVFGLIGKYAGITAGALILSMVSIIVLKLSTGKACMPKWMRRFAQVLAGAYIGSSVQYADVLEMKYLVVPAIILILGYSLACMMIGRFLNRTFNMSIKESMLTATPAGASDMALIAADIGVESADVIVLQIIRMVVVVSVFPQLISLIVKLAG